MSVCFKRDRMKLRNYIFHYKKDSGLIYTQEGAIPEAVLSIVDSGPIPTYSNYDSEEG